MLEEHPENYGTPFYILGRLMANQIIKGREGEPPFQPVGDPGDGTFDSLTGHTLRDGPAPFRNFWLNNGGLEVFGRPKSEQFQEVNKANGQTYWVQYKNALTNANWDELPGEVIAAGDSASRADPVGSEMRFYRVRTQ